MLLMCLCTASTEGGGKGAGGSEESGGGGRGQSSLKSQGCGSSTFKWRVTEGSVLSQRGRVMNRGRSHSISNGWNGIYVVKGCGLL